MNLMGLDTDTDAVHDLYFNLTQQSTGLDLTNFINRRERVNKLALEIYSTLLKYKS
jgi:hypothetical protein